MPVAVGISPEEEISIKEMNDLESQILISFRQNADLLTDNNNVSQMQQPSKQQISLMSQKKKD